jgi:lipoprotein-anchoring transpeptidase ErfK/SrfK
MRSARGSASVAISLTLSALGALLATGTTLAGNVQGYVESSRLAAVQSQQQLDAQLLAASAVGYTSDDLGPILDSATAIDARPLPPLPNQRAAFYRSQAAAYRDLGQQLVALESIQLDLLRQIATSRLASLEDELARDKALGVDEIDLAGIEGEAAGVHALLAAAHSPTDYRTAFSNLGVPLEQAEQVRVQYENEMSAVQAEATRLKSSSGGNPDAIRAVAANALARGRDDAAWNGMMRFPAAGRAYDLLESNYRKVLAASDLDTLASAAALEEHYRDQVHQVLVARLPRKVVLVSIGAQELWAYDGGQLYIDTLVTTGMPQLPTDVGLMRIFRKESPVHFISPFPKGSPYDYGSIDAKYAMFFQPSGEAIHDSWWRHWYGPGSNLNGRGSHGCIGLPYGPIDKIYPWGDIGVPVVVIPGDGTTAANQLAQKTYDDPAWGDGPAWF